MKAWIGLWLFTTANCAVAQTYSPTFPNRPVRFIVPFPPGGGADVIGRVISQKLTDKWGQQVVVDNRAGAGGNIAAEKASQR
jgi:tripartite-type tricarboxylate transporter receptor subunit TctC